MTTASPAPRSPLWIAVPAAFAVRLLYLMLSGRAIDAADSIHYIYMAQQFAAGDFLGFDENLPILYSALAALAHFAISDWEAAFWAVSLIASTLTVVPVYFLSRELHGERAARTMALLVVLWPWLIDYASRIQPEALAVLLWFTSLWFVYRAVTQGGISLVFAPVALFLLHLARPEGTILMLAAPFGAALLAYGEHRIRTRRVVTLGAAVAALTALYMLFMRFAVGTATVSYRAPMSGDLADYFRRGAVELGQTFFTVTFNALPVMIGPFLLLFMGLGIFSRPETGRNRRLITLVGFYCLVQYAVTLANFSPSPRYVMPIVIACGLWAAWGLVRAHDVLCERGRTRWAYAPLGVVLATFVFSSSVSLSMDRLGSIPATPIEYRAAGEWMKDNLEPGLILSRKPQVGFYAGMPTTGPDANDDVPALLRRAEDTGARYVVVDERYTAGLVPGVASLLDSAAAPVELKPVYEVAEWARAKVVVYEVAIEGMRYLSPEEFPRPDSHMGPDERRRKTPAP